MTAKSFLPSILDVKDNLIYFRILIVDTGSHEGNVYAQAICTGQERNTVYSPVTFSVKEFFPKKCFKSFIAAHFINKFKMSA